jgi:hypothetical protein
VAGFGIAIFLRLVGCPFCGLVAGLYHIQLQFWLFAWAKAFKTEIDTG